MRRAAHQLYDDPPLIFTDPLAMRVLPAEARAEVHEKAQTERTHPFAQTMRAFMCARSRFAEDALEHAVAHGVRQYVVLGAGLDTYAGRSPHRDLRIFEVDYPATQAWKRACLEQGEIKVSDSVTFVPVDFEHEGWMERLTANGFDAGAPAFCSWLGVLPYLTCDAAVNTFRSLGSLPAGSGVAFDYVITREIMSDVERAGFDWLAERVARAGEPFRLSFDPAELRQLLLSSGFTQVEDLDGSNIATRYFTGRTDGLTVRGRAGRLVCAWRDNLVR